MYQKLKSQLLKITDKHVDSAIQKSKNSEYLLEFQSKFELSSKYIGLLTDELIEATNKFLEENNIDDTSQSEVLVKNEILRFKDRFLTGK